VRDVLAKLPMPVGLTVDSFDDTMGMGDSVLAFMEKVRDSWV
jgi:hypothetical protein